MKLSEYVLKRNGVPMGASNSLKNMLYRSFGAKTLPFFGIIGIPFGVIF